MRQRRGDEHVGELADELHRPGEIDHAVIVGAAGELAGILFRAAFDEFFPDDRIIEVDVPGLTTPVLKNVPYSNIPRPLYPLDEDWGFTVGEPEMFAARSG